MEEKMWFNEAEIKKCPFCGSTGWLDFSGNGNRPFFDDDGKMQYTNLTFIVTCMNCYSRTGEYREPKNAVAAWNKRVGEQGE